MVTLWTAEVIGVLLSARTRSGLDLLSMLIENAPAIASAVYPTARVLCLLITVRLRMKAILGEM